METTKKTTTETTPSNNHTSPNQLSNSSDKRILETQQGYRFPDKIVRYLEGKISELEGCYPAG